MQPDDTKDGAPNPNAALLETMRENFCTARRRHRWIIGAAGLYALMVAAEIVYCRAPFEEVFRVFKFVYGIFMKSIMLLGVMGLVYYVRCFFKPLTRGLGLHARGAQAMERLEKATDRYFASEVFAHGCMGLVVLSAVMMFFFAKSLLPAVHGYSWDPALSKLDYALHFGHYPHALVAPIVEALHLPRVLDDAYLLWFLMMYAVCGFNVFGDRDLKRRLQFLWTFLLSWVICGTVMATLFSSVGPMFYHHFYPLQDNPYAALSAYISHNGARDFPLVYHTRDMLLEWATNGKLINPNAISAFPSLHVGIAWLAVLYARRIGWKCFALALVFWLSIFIGSIFFGFHYAVDDYASMLVITAMWWGVGRGLDKAYPADKKWDLQILSA